MNKVKKTDWINTFEDRAFYPLEPDIELISIGDIAHSLSLQCRFNGHCVRHYSVAEHSINCLKLAREMGLSYMDRYWALMHDAAEAYLADIPRPVKRIIQGYKEYETELELLIAKKFGLEPLWIPDRIREIDDIMLATERRDLFTGPLVWGSLHHEPTDRIKIESSNYRSVAHFPPPYWENRFLGEFKHLREALQIKD